jgi:hypothetical protein
MDVIVPVVAVGSSASAWAGITSAGVPERSSESESVVWKCWLMQLMIANLKVAAIQPESVDGSCP